MWEVQRRLADVQAPLIDAGRAHVGLHSQVGVDLFEARDLLDTGMADAALELLLPGLAEELDRDWAEAARQDATGWRLQALAAAAQDAAEAGRTGVAVSHARRRVLLDPLSEAAHCDLIRLLAGCGDRGAAMAAYEQMRLVLEADLGIGPSETPRHLLADLGPSGSPLRGSSPPAGAATRPRRRLPATMTPLLGRQAELVDLKAAVSTDRLVCVVGPAGVGKTRTALAVVEWAADLGQPVAVAELATTRHPGALDYVVAAALGVLAGPGREIRDAMVDQLELEPGLLVLDNCEHLLPSVRDLVTHLLRWSPSTHVLATSREALALPGERAWQLHPLPVPADEADEATIRSAPAIQLLTRTGGAEHALEQPRHDARQLVRLARRLDGLPLALELAAARIGSLGAAVLTDRLAESLDVLSYPPAADAGADVEQPSDVDVSTSGLRRHDSLITTLEWSMTMLPARERTLLGLVAQLSGPFPMAIVQAMVDAAGVSIDAVVGMARLVEANLVQVHQDEVWCYSTLETIRVFGRGLLDDVTASRAREGLVRWADLFAGSIWARRLSQEAGMHVEVVRFLPLVRAALQEARDRGEVAAQRRIIVGLEGWSVWREQPEVWAWISELAVREPAEHADAGVLRMGAVAAWRLGRMDLFRDLSRRCVAADPDGANGTEGAAALSLLAEVEQRWEDVIALIAHAPPSERLEEPIIWNTQVARALVELGRPRAARELSRRACRDAEELGSPSVRAVALLAAARVLTSAGPIVNDEDPEVLLVEARQLADSVGSAELVASIDHEYGLLHLSRGLPDLATPPLRAACLHWLATGNRDRLGEAVEALARALRQTGRSDLADLMLAGFAHRRLTAPQFAALLPLPPPAESDVPQVTASPEPAELHSRRDSMGPAATMGR